MGALHTPRTERHVSIAAAAGWLAAAICLTIPIPIPAETSIQDGFRQSDELVLALKGGEPVQGFPVAGLLLSESCPSGRCGVYARCSGILGATDRFFTAGHCVADRGRPYWVFLQHAGIVRVAPGGIQHYCDDRPDCDGAIHDLASLSLAEPVPGIALPVLGSRTTGSVQIVGFGDSGPMLPDHGILRRATVATVPCESGLICYRYTNQTPAACNHDSGGPMFREQRLIGLARRSEHGCVDGLGSYTDLTVPAVADWWRTETDSEPRAAEAAVADQTFDCVGTACWRVVTATPHDRQIQVHPGARRLIVTMNHALLAGHSDCQGGLRQCAVDYDLSVTGPDPDAAPAGCVCNNEFFQVAVCSCPTPPQGTWRVSIHATGARGPYQITGRVIY